MCSKKKILAFTSIRSDYDLMSGLYRQINESEEMELRLVVSGAHLSDSYGYSYDNIKQDGFDVLSTIETLFDSNSKQARIKSAAVLLQALTDVVASYNPDVLIYAGDREDAIVYALLGSYLQIPTIHFFGGDHVNDGHVDNPVRHATSKLSSIHFVTLPQHKERLIKMGESTDRIFVTGALSLDRFYQHTKTKRENVFKYFDIKADKDYALVIFHPQDIEISKSHIILKTILDKLKEKGLFCFVSYPNTDPGSRNVIKVIEELRSDTDNFYFYKNLDSETFLSLYKNAKIQVGNSSAGIIESASIPLPVVNVGLRQKGRVANSNVIFCETDERDISIAIDKALSSDFLENIKTIKNIYGDGNSVKKSFEYLKKINFKDFLYKTEDPLKEQ